MKAFCNFAESRACDLGEKNYSYKFDDDFCRRIFLYDCMPSPVFHYYPFSLVAFESLLSFFSSRLVLFFPIFSFFLITLFVVHGDVNSRGTRIRSYDPCILFGVEL